MAGPPLALHTWSLDTTPLERVCTAARTAGFDGIELRRLDYVRASDAGRDASWVHACVRTSGLAVACVGVELGWMYADGPQRARLLTVFGEQCDRARALGARLVMSSVDRGAGDLARAAVSVREVGAIAAARGVRLALEFNSLCEQINRLEIAREILARAAHPACGLLLDTYHLGRSGASLKAVEDVTPEEIAYVQYSDVPAGVLDPRDALNRLPPGRGTFPFRDFFAVLRAKDYRGFLSYEAPNPAAWQDDPLRVAREALEATRALL